MPYLAIPPYISPYLPIPRHLSPYLPTSRHISPYLPIPPYTSPYLPISPHISPYLTVRYVQGVNDVATPFFLVLLADGLPRGSAHTAEDVDEVLRNLLGTF